MASNRDVDLLEKQLWDAAWRGDQEQVALALDQGANFNWRNPNCLYYAPLHIAALHGHESVARLLLYRGASINATNKYNSTPLHIAAVNGYESIARLLLDRGASINAKDKYNMTPLHDAARNGHESIVRLFLERGADTTIVSVRQYPCCCC